jgi:L-lactate dehydrogenase complex protein LldG
MSEARSRILGRLRPSGSETGLEPAEIPVRRFDWDPEACLRRFRERMESVRGEVHRVDGSWPCFLCDLLKRKGARNLLYGPAAAHGSELEGAWPADPAVGLVPYLEPVEVCRGFLFDDADAAFTGCRGAIAETGSLVLWPTPEEPRLMSLVPPIHVVLLEAGDIRSSFHELVTEQGWGKGMPTNALLISGPSKSADIEQTLAYGVHGPEQLIVLVR